ncbi:MAG TPA: FAD-linked oxidase C-terminal domain-containing protein, partial [Myxococcota bacterium]|nr:FAD-linked oxidase C-terminal domain-containing protein [Myxococcota bacterium]
MAAFDSVETAGEAVSAIIARGLVPATMEMMDQRMMRIIEDFVHPGLPVEAGAALIIETDGYAESVTPQLDEIIEILEAHSAFYPLRAWLRLVDAGLVGHAALAAHRARGGLAAIAPLPRFLPRLAAIEGGLGAVTQVLRRALAFVVQNAGGYADNQWATSPLRAAAPEAVDAILGPPAAPRATPRAYTGADVLALTTGPGWPKMDADGYLPKTQAIDDRGQPLRPPARLTQGELACADAVLVQRACAAMITDLVAHTDDLVLSSLHRSARQVLGEHPHDLGRLSPEERMQVIVDELVPQVAGRVRGDLSDPRAFVDCANVLHQLVALGGDTRRFRADEPGALVAAEASRLRARAAVEGWPDA